ncbi:hypothetical protein PGB34_19250 [Xenophilus arseniciresistens]|uniref:Uncharacterized protein n=1 Tax=Xenophilus arseniciresistens TaxID=1283306 RepID=A0AAE3NC67_9BURK|nr:hypothetical protein [Xenophilus arseniciresistens]MDA7418513.1 hypothetical protein [Xenophilus arseniciresistens]
MAFSAARASQAWACAIDSCSVQGPARGRGIRCVGVSPAPSRDKIAHNYRLQVLKSCFVGSWGPLILMARRPTPSPKRTCALKKSASLIAPHFLFFDIGCTMSHDIRIWERPMGQPNPTSLEEAGRTMQALERLRPGLNPKFMALAERMAARYPVLGREQQFVSATEDDGNGAAWLGDPREQAKNCTEAVWAFELPTEDPVRALRFVVDNANALGLTVLDDQIGMVFVPPDQVLPPEHAALWQSAKREMDAPQKRWSVSKARKEMKDRIAQLLAHTDFRLDESRTTATGFRFSRVTEAGTQSIYVGCRAIHGEPQCTVRASVGSQAVAQVMHALFPDRLESSLNEQVGFDFGSFHGNPSTDVPVESAEQALAILRTIKESPGFQILDITRTVPGMHRILTEMELFTLHQVSPKDPRTLAQQWRETGGGSPALIFAWLIGSDHFEEIEHQARQLSKDWSPEGRQREHAELDRVLAYLREHCKRGAIAG